MLGIVFSEFIEMVEEKFSEDTADQLLEVAEKSFASEGVYTAVGNYDHVEMLTLVGELAELTKMPVPDLVHAYGKHLFGRFNALYPIFFENINDSLEFLEGIESHIHTEVRKLYPEAELPEFVCRRPGENVLVMNYQSGRPLAMLAHGLIDGCIYHFQENVSVVRKDLPGEAFTAAQFTLTKNLSN